VAFICIFFLCTASHMHFLASIYSYSLVFFLLGYFGLLSHQVILLNMSKYYGSFDQNFPALKSKIKGSQYVIHDYIGSYHANAREVEMHIHQRWCYWPTCLAMHGMRKLC